MRCPKCSFTQPAGPECLRCGIIFDKYRTVQESQEPTVEDPVSEPEVAPAERPVGNAVGNATTTQPPVLSPVRQKDDPFEKPIRTSLRIVRTGAGVLAVSFGSWLFVWGQDCSLAPFHVLLLITYGCVGLFWVLSAPLKVSVRQFAIEMLLFVFATVLLKVALPEAFDLGTTSNKTSGPLSGGGLPGPSEPVPPDADIYAGVLDKLANKARDVLDDPENTDRVEGWLRECRTIKHDFRRMDREQRKSVENAYKATVALEQKMERLKTNSGSDEADQAFEAVENLEKVLASLEP
jgi:hypothetical protein